LAALLPLQQLFWAFLPAEEAATPLLFEQQDLPSDAQDFLATSDFIS
jgi:hypothetical protein